MILSIFSGRMTKKRTKKDLKIEAPQNAATTEPVALGLDIALENSTHVESKAQCDGEHVIAKLQANMFEASSRTRMAVMTKALQENDVDETLLIFIELKDSWEFPSTFTAQQDKMKVLAQVVSLACETHHLNQLMPALVGMEISEETIQTMLTECTSTRDIKSAELTEWIARAHHSQLADTTYVLLIQCFALCAGLGERVVREVLERASPQFSEELALAIIDFCSGSWNKQMADILAERMEPKSLSVLAALIRFYATGQHYEEACGILEDYLPSFNGVYLHHPIIGMIDNRTAWHLMVSALECGRRPLATYLFGAVAGNAQKHIVTIQKWWKHGHVTKSQTCSLRLAEMRNVSSRLSQVFQSASLECDDDFPWPPSPEPIEKPEHPHVKHTVCQDDPTSTTVSDCDHHVVARFPIMTREWLWAIMTRL